MTSTDKIISRTDTSRASLAEAEFKRTGRQTSPYTAYPERETYTETETYERPDGTRYTRKRQVSRWAGSFSFGEWEVAS